MCNIVLDLLLVLVFHLDVAGVAIATVASQLLSAVLVVIALMRSQGAAYQLELRQLRIHFGPMSLILRIGVPSAPPVGDVLRLQHRHPVRRQLLRHRHGGRLDRLRQDGRALLDDGHRHGPVGDHLRRAEHAALDCRMKRGLWVSAGVLGLFTVAISAVFFFLARPILTIFTPDPAVLEVGVEMVRFLAPSYITYIMIELLSGVIRGAGKSLVPMLIDVFGVCGLRLLWLFTVVPAHHTIEMVEASYPITWAVTSIALLIYYRFGRWLTPPKEAV